MWKSREIIKIYDDYFKQYDFNDLNKLDKRDKRDKILLKDTLTHWPSRSSVPNLTIPRQDSTVKVSQEQTPWVDLSDFLDQSLWTQTPEEKIWQQRDTSRMQVEDLIPEISLSFDDKEVEKEVSQIIKKLLNVKKLDFYKEDFDNFITSFDKFFTKLKNQKNSQDYKKILALKVFFLHLRKVYEYLSLTLFDIFKSKNKDIFDKDLIINTIKRKLNLDVTNSEYEDLKKVFESLKTLIISHTTDIGDLVFANINDNQKLYTELRDKYPNLATISEIKRVINNEKTITSNSADWKLKDIEEKDFQAEVLNSDMPVIVDFYWPNCAPCKTLQPILEKLAQKYNWKVKFVKLDVSKPTSIAWKYNVSWTPTVIAFNSWKNHWNPIVWAKSSSEYETLISSVIKEFENDPANEGKMFPKPNIEWKDHIINGVDFSDPKCIVEYLNIYATWQEHAKEVLAVAFSRFVTQWIVTSQLIVWPSGSGKTYMTNILCNLTGFKFINIWISNLSSAWIRWSNLKDQLEPLKWHKWKAILFLDEIDKLADSNNPHGQWIQNELLTLFNTDSPAQEYAWIDLKNIMIIWAWAFEDNGKWKSLYSMLKKKAWNKTNVFETLDDWDLIDYWLKPEIVWRLNWKTYLNALTVEQLYEMMTKKWSEIAKLTRELEESHIELVFTDEALLEIAKTAHKWVWARAIKSILEKIMKPISVRKVELAWKTIDINKKTVEEILSSSNSAEKDIDWNNTETIIAYLNRFVPWNDNAKRALANSFKEFMIHGKLSHAFIYWESWAWKTYMISLLCKAAWIQMWEASLANLTSEWFKWTSLGDVIKNSFSKGHMWKSPKKVLFLDEIDKLINRTWWRLSWWNFWSDIINELLSIFNGTSETWIDLSNCLIISAWACAWNADWESLKQIVQKRLGWSNKVDDNSLLEQVEKDDLETYWFKTELVWRFKRVSFLESVNKDYLRKVMFESEWSVYKKKLEEAKNEWYNLTFSTEAIELILEAAENMRTWVRALETVLNRLYDKIYENFAKWDLEIDGEYTDKVLNPKTKFEHPDMDKIDWTSPQTVKAYLDTKAQWNERYKENLSLIFWKLKRKIETWNDKIKIPNLLVLWPSGWWKTYLLEILAPLLWIPFVKTNVATVEANYSKWAKIWDVFDKVWKSVWTAIIFIDEVDKILSNPTHPLNNELMSYLEWWNHEWRSLKDFVFVWAWAFQWYNVTDDEWNVNFQELEKIWVKPEVLWRCWIIIWVDKMDIKKMTAIIKSENSVFNQRVKNIQEEYGIDVVLADWVLEYICEIALKQPTWARALELLTNFIFTWFEFNIWKYLDKWEILLDLENTKNLLKSLSY